MYPVEQAEFTRLTPGDRQVVAVFLIVTFDNLISGGELTNWTS